MTINFVLFISMCDMFGCFVCVSTILCKKCAHLICWHLYTAPYTADTMHSIWSGILHFTLCDCNNTAYLPIYLLDNLVLPHTTKQTKDTHLLKKGRLQSVNIKTISSMFCLLDCLFSSLHAYLLHSYNTVHIMLSCVYKNEKYCALLRVHDDTLWPAAICNRNRQGADFKQIIKVSLSSTLLVVTRCDVIVMHDYVVLL